MNIVLAGMSRSGQAIGTGFLFQSILGIMIEIKPFMEIDLGS